MSDGGDNRVVLRDLRGMGLLGLLTEDKLLLAGNSLGAVQAPPVGRPGARS